MHLFERNKYRYGYYTKFEINLQQVAASNGAAAKKFLSANIKKRFRNLESAYSDISVAKNDKSELQTTDVDVF